MELEKENEGDLSLLEATEYVRQQLASMGVKNVSGRELEVYTRDFLQLLKEKEKDPTELSTESGSVCAPPNPSSAVFKVSVRNDGDHFVKRKVLRRFDSETTFGDSSIDAEVLSESHPTSPTSRAPSSSSSCYSRQPKSFIRPAPSLPGYVGRLRKSDPVQRYHEYKEGWKTQQPPGEKPRHGLRWHIREQLLTQDTPTVPPPRKTHQSSSYVVPTSKKRQNLRWEIRHQLASNT